MGRGCAAGEGDDALILRFRFPGKTAFDRKQAQNAYKDQLGKLSGTIQARHEQETPMFPLQMQMLFPGTSQFSNRTALGGGRIGRLMNERPSWPTIWITPPCNSTVSGSASRSLTILAASSSAALRSLSSMP